MRQTLASVILRLLGNRVVHEDEDLSFNPAQSSLSKREAESSTEAASAAMAVLSGESLFDRLLLVLHGLLSSCRPSWLRMKCSSKAANDFAKDLSAFDRELAENLQVSSLSVDLLNMLLLVLINYPKPTLGLFIFNYHLSQPCP